MKQRIFVLKSNDAISSLTAFLLTQPKEPVLEVVIRKHRKSRSVLQNKLYWKMITVLSREWGWLKNETHNWCKRNFLIPIYEREDMEYAAMIHAVRKVHTEGYKEDAATLADQIVKLTTTTNASTKQFTEYLQEIYRHAADQNIALPHPDDLYGPQSPPMIEQHQPMIEQHQPMIEQHQPVIEQNPPIELMPDEFGHYR